MSDDRERKIIYALQWAYDRVGEDLRNLHDARVQNAADRGEADAILKELGMEESVLELIQRNRDAEIKEYDALVAELKAHHVAIREEMLERYGYDPEPREPQERV